MQRIKEHWITTNLELSDTQAAKFGIPTSGVHVRLLEPWDDGIAENTWNNRLAAGCVVQNRLNTISEEGLPPGHHSEIAPINNVIVQNRVVYTRLLGEVEHIAGPISEVPAGDAAALLTSVKKNRLRLTQWLSLTEAEKEDTSTPYEVITGDFKHARNLYKKQARDTADKMIGIMDKRGQVNPPANAARSAVLESALEKRVDEALDKIEIGDDRKRRLMQWLVRENVQLATIDGTLTRLKAVKTRDDEIDALGDLHRQASALYFRHQPFNHMGFEMREAGSASHVSQPEIIETAQAGMEFESHGNELMRPFRIVSALQVDEAHPQPLHDSDKTLHDINERIAFLEERKGTVGGAYEELFVRLITEAKLVKTAIHNQDPLLAQSHSEGFNGFVNFHCLPGNDQDARPWYRFQI